MRIRPCRNRMSRFVAAEMRYFHRPFAMSVLSCCTAIITLVSALLSLLSYVGSSDKNADARLYLNLSVGLLISLLAAYIIYVIIKWGRLPSYSLVMSFTAVNYVAAAIGGFLLSRSILYDMLEESFEGGYGYFLDNILGWSFWTPAAIILLFFAASFIKSKTAGTDGGWWYVIFTFMPLSIIPFVSFVMRLEIEKEDFVTVTSFSVMLYVTIMLSIAARYAVKAVMNKFLTDLPVFEDAVVIKSTYRASDGKRIHWWEKKPPAPEDDRKETDTAPVSKPRAFWSRFAAWFKRIFATAAPPDVAKPDAPASESAQDIKTEKQSKKAEAAPDGSAKSQDSEKKKYKYKQAKSNEAIAESEEQQNKEQPEDTEQPNSAEKSNIILKSKKPKAKKNKGKKAKAGAPTATDSAEPLASSDSADIPAGSEAVLPKTAKLSDILANLKSKQAKDKAKKPDKKTYKKSDDETNSSAEDTVQPDDIQPAVAEQLSEDTLKTEKPENDDTIYAESEETAEETNGEIVDDESSSDYFLDNEPEDGVPETELDENTETETAANPDSSDSASTAESEEYFAEQQTSGLLNRVVDALNVAMGSVETQSDADTEQTEAVAADNAEANETEADKAERAVLDDGDTEKKCCSGCGADIKTESKLCPNCGLYQS